MATTSATCLGLVLLTIWPSKWIEARATDLDILLPYVHGHGPLHSHRHVRDCLSDKNTYETWQSSNHKKLPVAESTVFISDLPGNRDSVRWAYGHMTVVHDPLRTLMVLEPGEPGGCEKQRRATVEETAVAAGCLYALNAGFFNTISGQCLGNVVSNGQLVRDSGGTQNAQFGIRKDGSLVFGYLSQEDVLDRSNPFVQLVSGVVWLLRNGCVYINESLKAECDNPADQEVLHDFVNVLSARTVVGHDADGRVVLFHVEGQTGQRGMNLWEVAEFLKEKGLINAINLDGGGSSSFVVNGTLTSYPPDKCESDSRWRCARPVSTILCVHQQRCEPANCSGHGACVNGRCQCQDGWQGSGCDSLVCQSPWCSPHGVCTEGGCVCDAGWTGENCSQECLPGHYGDGCKHSCICFNGASCNHIDGRCACLPGFHGNFCEQVCPPGFYGVSCAEKCQCMDKCPCDPQTGICAYSSDSRLKATDQCLVNQIFFLWRQQEAYKDNPYLRRLSLLSHGEMWLMVTVVLTSLLLIKMVFQFMRLHCR